METEELVKKMFTRQDETDEILGNLNKTRTISLKEAIQEIQEQIVFRENLHKEMMQNIEELKSSINNMFPPIPNISAEFQKSIVELKKKLIEAEEMKVQEKLNCFRDIAQLKKELREWIREFRDKEERANLLDSYLK